MPKTLSESDLRKQLANELGLKPKELKRIEETQQKLIEKNLKKGVAVKVPVIGTVFTKKIPAKKGGKKATNPFTGETYITKSKPASTKVKVRPSTKLKSIF